MKKARIWTLERNEAVEKRYPGCNVKEFAEYLSFNFEPKAIISENALRYHAAVVLGVPHGTKGRRGRKDEVIYPAGITWIKPWHMVHRAPD